MRFITILQVGTWRGRTGKQWPPWLGGTSCASVRSHGRGRMEAIADAPSGDDRQSRFAELLAHSRDVSVDGSHVFRAQEARRVRVQPQSSAPELLPVVYARASSSWPTRSKSPCRARRAPHPWGFRDAPAPHQDGRPDCDSGGSRTAPRSGRRGVPRRPGQHPVCIDHRSAPRAREPRGGPGQVRLGGRRTSRAQRKGRRARRS